MKNKRKIIFVVHSAWAFINFRKNLADYLIHCGYQLEIFMPFDEEIFRKYDKRYSLKKIYINPKGINPFVDLYSLIQLLFFFTISKPDIVLLFSIKPNIYGNLAARFLKIPTITNITGLGSAFIKDSLLTKFVTLLYKISIKPSNKIFFQNKEDMSFFLRKKIIYETSAAIIPGSGVDLSRFFPRSKNNEFFSFIFIGRLIKDKGINEFINAVKKFRSDNDSKNVNFFILGELSSQNPTAITKVQLQKWIDDDIIQYLGFVDNVEDVLQNIDCLVLPSYREGLPKVVLEALAMKKLVMVSDVPGCREIIKHLEDGLIFKPKSSNDIHEKMKYLLSMSDSQREKLRQNGLKKVSAFYDERILFSIYLSNIQTLLK